MNLDPLTDLRSRLSGEIDSIFSQKANVSGRLDALRETYPDCLELSLASAISTFYSEDPDKAIRLMVEVAGRLSSMYEISRMDLVDFHKIRKISSVGKEIKGFQYTQAAFCINYIRHLKGHSDIFSWIDYEKSKKIGSGNYNDLYLLRNMVWALNESPLSLDSKKKIKDEVEGIDAKILEILQRKIASKQPAERRKIRRIAICAGLMKHSRRGMHARLVIDYARNLAEFYPGIEVLILVTNEIPFDARLFSFSMARVSDRFREELESVYEGIVEEGLKSRVVFENLELTNPGWQDLMSPIKRVIEFDPDVVMHYGSKFHNESYFVRRSLYDLYPTAYFFSQMNNVVDRFNDVYLARNEQPLRGKYEESKIRVAPPAVRSKILSEKFKGRAFSYEALDVKKSRDEVTIVTVLAGDRMAAIFRGYSPEVRQKMMGLLDAAENARWIWLGPKNVKSVIGVDPLFGEYYRKGKLDVRSFEDNLAAFYAHCDLFLHLPKFTGGAGGMSMALSAGIPVLCFKDTDASSRVVPGNTFDPDRASDFFDRAAELVRSETARELSGRQCLEYYDSLDIGSLVESTYAGLVDAVREYNKRANFSS